MPSLARSLFPSRRSLLRGSACALGFALPAVAQEPNAPADEVKQLRKRLYDSQFASLRNMAVYFKRLRGKFGPGVVEEIKAVTIEDAKRELGQAPIPPDQRNLAQVKKLFAGMTESATYEWVEDTPTRLQARVTRCRWAEELKKVGADGDLGFAMCCAYDFGYCAGLNPKIKFTRTKTMMQGADHCNHTYELKA